MFDYIICNVLFIYSNKSVNTVADVMGMMSAAIIIQFCTTPNCSAIALSDVDCLFVITSNKMFVKFPKYHNLFYIIIYF